MAVIEFENVSKAYRLGANQGSLRRAIPQLAKRLVSRSSADDENLFWALRDVNFKVDQGEVVGFIGHNGAGKSTSLKLLSKVTYPTSGQIRTKGRMAALIELGAGFHPDLTGRENIYLNGSVLGLKRREIDAQLDSIVEFAELEKFIDTPVKRYSSGMYVRLAFAVAAHVKADMLLVDEVLSVGDANFQQKCMNRMIELRDDGATIIFISHNLWAVQGFCSRVILLSGGRLIADGEPEAAVDQYKLLEREKLAARVKLISSGAGSSHYPAHENQVAILSVEVLNDEGKPAQKFDADGALLARVQYEAAVAIPNPLLKIRIRRADGVICCDETVDARGESSLTNGIYGPGTFEMRVDRLQLTPDMYTVEAEILDAVQPVLYATSMRETFTINGILRDEYAGVFHPSVSWRVEQSLVGSASPTAT